MSPMSQNYYSEINLHIVRRCLNENARLAHFFPRSPVERG